MSFTVRASNSPLPQQRSPASQPYASPQIPSQSSMRHGVPPFSLSGSDDSHNVASSKRIGTDPTKYKTTMCRNWEQTGTCTFRGCTFAHGVDELRAPTRVDHQRSPNLDPRRPSPSSTPPLYPTTISGSSGSPRIEQLLEMLYAEVVRERDLVTVHMEANRTLEVMLKKEQAIHEETKVQLESVRQRVEVLTQGVLKTSEEINNFLDSCNLSESQRSRFAALTQRMIDVLPKYDNTTEKMNAEEVRVKELLNILQQCQKPTNT